MGASDWAGEAIADLQDEFDITKERALRMTDLVRWLVSSPEFEDLRDQELIDGRFNDVFINNLIKSLNDQPGDSPEERWNNLVKEFGLYEAAGDGVLLPVQEPTDTLKPDIDYSHDQKFMSKEGDILTYEQIGYIVWNDGITVEKEDGTLRVNDTIYHPMKSQEEFVISSTQNTIADFEEPSEQAKQLKFAAQRDPYDLDTESVFEILTTPAAAPTTHVIAVQALVIAGAGGREIDAKFTEPLVTLLDRPSLNADTLLLNALREVSRNTPDQVLDSAGDRIFQEVKLDDSKTTQAALKCCSEMAVGNEEKMLELTPKLGELVKSENQSIRRHASYILSQIAHGHPDEVKPVTPTLLKQISSSDENYQINTLSALGHVVSRYPNVGRPAVSSLVDLLESSSEKVRGNAVGLLADISKHHPDVVSQHISEIADRLHDPDETVRGNAVSVILHIGIANSDEVQNMLPAIIELIDDPSPVVRRNTIRTLGRLQATVAIEQLRSLSESDPDEGVRETASWALDRIVD